MLNQVQIHKSLCDIKPDEFRVFSFDIPLSVKKEFYETTSFTTITWCEDPGDLSKCQLWFVQNSEQNIELPQWSPDNVTINYGPKDFDDVIKGDKRPFLSHNQGELLSLASIGTVYRSVS